MGLGQAVSFYGHCMRPHADPRSFSPALVDVTRHTCTYTHIHARHARLCCLQRGLSYRPETLSSELLRNRMRQLLAPAPAPAPGQENEYPAYPPTITGVGSALDLGSADKVYTGLVKIYPEDDAEENSARAGVRAAGAAGAGRAGDGAAATGAKGAKKKGTAARVTKKKSLAHRAQLGVRRVPPHSSAHRSTSLAVLANTDWARSPPTPFPIPQQRLPETWHPAGFMLTCVLACAQHWWCITCRPSLWAHGSSGEGGTLHQTAGCHTVVHGGTSTGTSLS